jgi:hypothetical protein
LSSGGTGAYPTGSFTTGTVTGLGSIIVNGVRYDDSKAIVSRSDAGPVGALRPGMLVSIEASNIAAATDANALPTSTAHRITYASEWRGKVDAIDVQGRTITVLGQTVSVPAGAVFDGDAPQLAGLTAQQYVEVHGYLDLSSNRLLATRVDVSNHAPAEFRLSGRVSALDTSARTFSVGSAAISYDATVGLPAAWANGMLVRVALATTQVDGMWQASRISPRESVLAALQVQDQAESDVGGTVTSLDGPSRLTINGSISVDLSRAQITGTLELGAGVEIRGTVVNDAISATHVDVKTDSQLEVNEYDFFGVVSNLDTSSQRFDLQGLTFAYTANTLNDVQDWTTGATPSVRVTAMLSDGIWIASEIRP